MFFVRGGIVPYDFQQSWENLSLTFVLGNVFVWKGTFFYLISFTNSKWSFWFFAVKSQIVLKFPFQLHFTPLLEENSFPQKIAQDMFPSYRCKINKRRGFKPCKLWTTAMWLFLHLSQFLEWIHFPWDHKEILCIHWKHSPLWAGFELAFYVRWKELPRRPGSFYQKKDKKIYDKDKRPLKCLRTCIVFVYTRKHEWMFFNSSHCLPLFPDLSSFFHIWQRTFPDQTFPIVATGSNNNKNKNLG